MKISNKALLKSIFAVKRNFSRGIIPPKKKFDGVEIAPYKNDAKAAVSISADFELNWAWRELSPKERDFRGLRARKNFPYIVKLLEDHTIPITWATVGHLFLESCGRGKGGLPHPDMPRPPSNERWVGDWYIHDPCSDYRKDPLWYAPDLIQKLLESNVPHEIGIHSFSHIDFSPPKSNEELVEREIEKCATSMEPYGMKPRSLVFPFNNNGHSYLYLLSILGITAIRHRDDTVRLSYPERTESGVYKIYESMNLRRPRYYDYLEKAKMFIQEAAKQNAAFHIWFHPSDPTEVFENEFLRIIEHIHKVREEGVVWVATMKELAAYCEAREKINLKVKRKDNEIKVQIECPLDVEKYDSPDISLVIPDERVPRVALLESNGNLRRLNREKEFLKNGDDKFVVSMPVKANSLTLLY
jgi:peptidoglycan/xylan/chitin deacetylase (PgdA/CDA1 family)